MNTCPLCKREWEVAKTPLRYDNGYIYTHVGSASVTALQSRIVKALLRGPLSRERLMSAVYEEDADGGPLSAENCLSVHLHRLRKKLKPLGYGINTLASGPRHETPYVLQPLDAT